MYIEKKVELSFDGNDEIARMFCLNSKEFTLIKGTLAYKNERDFVLIYGISGSGKSLCLREIADAENVPIIKVNIDELQSVDTLLKDYVKDIRLLSKLGLSDVITFLTPVKHLSDGQKYRVQLAKILTAASASNQRILLIDEFCNQLDMISTLSIVACLKRIIEKSGVSIIVATARELYTEYDYFTKIYKIENSNILPLLRKRSKSIVDDVTFRAGNLLDWDYFKRWHYRSHSCSMHTNILTFYYHGHKVGILVIGLPYLDISCRNKIYPDYKKNGFLVNEEIRTIHRVVIAPEFRSLGLTKYMLNTYIGRIMEPEVKLIEIFTSLHDMVPFLESAGFLYGGEPLKSPMREFMESKDFNFSRYLDDEYLDSFIAEHFETLKKKVAASLNRGISGGKKKYVNADHELIKTELQRYCNVSTKYFYKIVSEDERMSVKTIQSHYSSFKEI